MNKMSKGIYRIETENIYYFLLSQKLIYENRPKLFWELYT